MTTRRLILWCVVAPSTFLIGWVLKDCACAARGDQQCVCPRVAPPIVPAPHVETLIEKVDRLNRALDCAECLPPKDR